MALEQSTNMIIIKTVDNKTFSINKDIIKQSRTIKAMLEQNNSTTITLSHEKCTLIVMMKIKKFLEYIYYHPDEAQLITQYSSSLGVSPLSTWLNTLIDDINNSNIAVDMNSAGTYLDCDILNNFMCSVLLINIKSFMPTDILAMFPS